MVSPHGQFLELDFRKFGHEGPGTQAMTGSCVACLCRERVQVLSRVDGTCSARLCRQAVTRLVTRRSSTVILPTPDAPDPRFDMRIASSAWKIPFIVLVDFEDLVLRGCHTTTRSSKALESPLPHRDPGRRLLSFGLGTRLRAWLRL